MQDSNYTFDRSSRTMGETRKPLMKSSRQKAPISRCRGFTLLELMIAITVAAVLLAAASPSLRTFRANNQIATANNSIVTALNLARFNAVTRGENVLICPSSDSIKCSHGKWYQGWIVFRENGASNDADAFTPAEADIIRVGVQTGDLKPDPGFTDSIVFEVDGTTSVAGATLIIDVCYNNTSYSKRRRQISISPFGPISSSSVTTPCSS